MHLILWRHAEAEDEHPGGDAARRLTTRGEVQARHMAEWLDKRLPKDTLILASPACRTQQTAAALQRPFETETGIATTSGLAGHMTVLRRQLAAPHEAIVLVGHQPTLGQLAAYLLCGEAQDWSIRKGNLWWLQHRMREGHGQALLRAVLDPEWF